MFCKKYQNIIITGSICQDKKYQIANKHCMQFSIEAFIFKVLPNAYHKICVKQISTRPQRILLIDNLRPT